MASCALGEAPQHVVHLTESRTVVSRTGWDEGQSNSTAIRADSALVSWRNSDTRRASRSGPRRAQLSSHAAVPARASASNGRAELMPAF